MTCRILHEIYILEPSFEEIQRIYVKYRGLLLFSREMGLSCRNLGSYLEATDWPLKPIIITQKYFTYFSSIRNVCLIF